MLICPARPGQRVQITELARDGDDADVVLEVTQGMGTPARPRPGAVPAIGEQVTYTLDPGYFAQREFPPLDQTPWTHGGPPVRHAQTRPKSRSHDRVPPLRPGRRDRPGHRRRPGRHEHAGQRGIIVDSPPGAGKTTLVVRAAAELAAGGETCIIVAQTNNQVDDLTTRLARQRRACAWAAVGHRLRPPGRPARPSRRLGSDQRR